MDPRFINYVIEELQNLVSDLESGLQPANIALQEVVQRHLRPDFDRENGPGETLTQYSRRAQQSGA